MHLDDRVTIKTPEGVDLELTLAGAGSRMAAAFLDAVILLVVVAVTLIAATVLGLVAGVESGALLLGLISLMVTLEIVGYYVLFETLTGRTPGKAALGLRVTGANGEPLGFGAAAVRNLVRIVDFLPFGYGLGLVTMLLSPQNQRLGDMAAGTLVVRERFAEAEVSDAVIDEPPLPPGWDTSAVTAEELVLVRRFLNRSRSLPADRRAQIATQIAAKLRPRVTTPEPEPDDERFLRLVYAHRRAQER